MRSKLRAAALLAALAMAGGVCRPARLLPQLVVARAPAAARRTAPRPRLDAATDTAPVEAPRLPDRPPDSGGSTRAVGLRFVLGYLWPHGRVVRAKLRVIASLLLLVAAKLFVVRVPFFFKRAVDALAPAAGGAGGAAAAVGWMAIYGLSRSLYTVLQECRYLLFTPVGQSALRRFVADAFDHVQSLDALWLSRQSTGELPPVIVIMRSSPSPSSPPRHHHSSSGRRALSRVRARHARYERAAPSPPLQRSAHRARGSARDRHIRPAVRPALPRGVAGDGRLVRRLDVVGGRTEGVAPLGDQRGGQPALLEVLQRAHE